MQKEKLFNFFNDIRVEEDINRMIKDKIKEGLYLEFKQKQDSRDGKLSNVDKEHFSKALSGFANSGGGIFLWGVEVRKKDESAKKLKPINEVDNFIRSLKSLLLNAVQPFVDDIIIEKIPKNNSESRGYVKCYIPVSEKAPHRAMLTGREYYKRSVEGFYRLEHFDLEDMFGRRQRPFLEILLDIKSHQSQDLNLYELHFIFRNEGRSIAKYYGFVCSFDKNIEFISSHGQIKDITKLNKGNPTISCENNIGVIHPNGVNYALGHIIFRRINKTKKISGTINYYSENMMPKVKNFKI